jgi:tRNA threonylcarbamoyladenosine biosynthesis protein TsaE
MKTVYKIPSAKKMQQLGKLLAQTICESPDKSSGGAVVVALTGDLGAGKTQFAKGFARGLGITQQISSPTFVICRSYKIPGNKINPCPCFEIFFHIDCYRLEGACQADAIDIKNIIANERNIVVIEWPEVISSELPGKVLKIKFETIGKNSREIIFDTGFG